MAVCCNSPQTQLLPSCVGRLLALLQPTVFYLQSSGHLPATNQYWRHPLRQLCTTVSTEPYTTLALHHTRSATTETYNETQTNSIPLKHCTALQLYTLHSVTTIQLYANTEPEKRVKTSISAACIVCQVPTSAPYLSKHAMAAKVP